MKAPSARAATRVSAAILAAAVAFVCACAKKTVKKPKNEHSPLEASASLPEPGIHEVQFSTTSALNAVYFDYDRYSLREDARETLKKNATALKRNPEWEILVEGHCDDRGTVEYNLALGQNRAKTVREYYLLLGIAGNRVATISYGKEKPLCAAPEQTCRSKNRRAQTKLKTETATRALAAP